MKFILRQTFKPFNWRIEKTISKQELQTKASSLFNSDEQTKASFYLKRALKRNNGIYEDNYWLIEIMPIISVR